MQINRRSSFIFGIYAGMFIMLTVMWVCNPLDKEYDYKIEISNGGRKVHIVTDHGTEVTLQDVDSIPSFIYKDNL